MEPQDTQSPPVQTPEQPKVAPESGDYPVQVSISYPVKQSRILALFSLPFFLARLILIIPTIIIVGILMYVVLLLAWINQFVILFTGHSSKGLHGFMVGYMRWSTRANAYLYGLTDKYPPFRMEP